MLSTSCSPTWNGYEHTECQRIKEKQVIVQGALYLHFFCKQNKMENVIVEGFAVVKQVRNKAAV